jgi:hypothetical protein
LFGSLDRTPVQPEANPIQDGDVGTHEVEDFGGVGAVAPVAFDVYQTPQLVAGLPLQA